MKKSFFKLSGLTASAFLLIVFASEYATAKNVANVVPACEGRGKAAHPMVVVPNARSLSASAPTLQTRDNYMDKATILRRNLSEDGIAWVEQSATKIQQGVFDEASLRQEASTKLTFLLRTFGSGPNVDTSALVFLVLEQRTRRYRLTSNIARVERNSLRLSQSKVVRRSKDQEQSDTQKVEDTENDDRRVVEAIAQSLAEMRGLCMSYC